MGRMSAATYPSDARPWGLGWGLAVSAVLSSCHQILGGGPSPGEDTEARAKENLAWMPHHLDQQPGLSLGL